MDTLISLTESLTHWLFSSIRAHCKLNGAQTLIVKESTYLKEVLMSSQNTVMYNGENLYGYRMNANESEILEIFRTELLLMADELELAKGQTYDGSVYEGRFRDNPDYSIRYKEDCGFFLIQGERGNYNFLKGLPTKNRKEAKYRIMKQEIIWSSTTYECRKRKEFQAMWIGKYNVKYDSRKAWVEYAIAKIYEGFDIIDEELIDHYTKCLNNRYDTPYWKYDSSTMEFTNT